MKLKKDPKRTQERIAEYLLKMDRLRNDLKRTLYPVHIEGETRCEACGQYYCKCKGNE